MHIQCQKSLEYGNIGRNPRAKEAAAFITKGTDQKEEIDNMIKVGKPAPDFTASAFYKGKFVDVSLSDYKGKWVLLCFYPGDFTFV